MHPSSLGESNIALISTVPMKGTYTLIIFVSKETRTRIGQLGVKSFPEGYYTYTGSALGTGASSLKGRISRHLKKTDKKRHWHIDFLLVHRNAAVTAVVAAETARKMECELNCYIKKKVDARILVSDFGSSDCKENCKTHLFFFPDITEDALTRRIVKCYKDLGLTPFQVLPHFSP